MNKKGFAISVVLYTMVILVIGVFFLLLGIVRNRYTIGDGLKGAIIGLLGSGSLEKSDLLGDIIDNNYPLTEKDTDEERFITGYVDDNYVWYSGKLWRIISIDKDGNIKLITDGNMSSIAWNTTPVLDYKNSQIRSWLNNEFLKTLENTDLLLNATWDCTPYSSFPTQKLPTTDSVTEKVGLLTIYEYMQTGGTNNVDDSNSSLNSSYYWWTLSANTENSKVWHVVSDNYALENTIDNCYSVRPCIVLKSGVKITEGTGERDKPYIIEGDKAVGVKNELLNKRISGEYINFNDVLYRIVEIEDINGKSLTKVTMADYSVNKNALATSIAFGSSTTYSLSAGVGKYLDDWYQADSTSTTYASNYIKNEYKQMIATAASDKVVWYTGPTNGTNLDYSLAKSGTTVEATIGLGRYGEMFSSHFYKGWEDSAQYTWLITKLNSYLLWRLNNNSGVYAYPPDKTISVRPSFYLKSDVKITGGRGLVNDPYTISYLASSEDNEVIVNEDNYNTIETDDGNKCITGGNPNNYVWYSGKLWRIVCFNTDGTIKMVTQGNVTNLAWDTASSNLDYSNSQVRSWLNNEFLTTLTNTNDLLVKSKWDYTSDKTIDTTRPETTSYVEEKIGLLTMYEYQLVGGSDSYLNNGYYWWTMTQYNTYQSYEVNYNGNASMVSPLMIDGVRPSVVLSKDVEFDGGTGSSSNPYTIKNDITDASQNDLLTTRISGEYISFNNNKYRIVGIETINGQKLTKVTLADYSLNGTVIATNQIFGDNTTTFTTESGIGKYLLDWYNGESINTTYKAMIETNNILWYQGPTDGIGRDYTKAKDGSGISSVIGMGRYGEMFSSHYGSGSSNSSSFWLLTILGSNKNYSIDSYGLGKENLTTNSKTNGIRPSFYLKSNVKITSGNGTPNLPYKISL